MNRFAIALLILAGIFFSLIITVVLTLKPYQLPSGSMLPTIVPGDRIATLKLKFKPKRSDIVVFIPPRSVASSWVSSPDGRRYQVPFVQRIVGLPGDKIEIKEGSLFINDQQVALKLIGEFSFEGGAYEVQKPKIYEEIIGGREHTILHLYQRPFAEDNFGPYLVGEGEMFVMGDNRDDSADSRSWPDDPARLKDITGKVLIVYFSYDKYKGRVRPDRFGKIVR